MSDYEKAKQLFLEFGIIIRESTNDGEYEDYPKLITISAGSGDKNKGYSNFVAEFAFQEDGKFINVGIWE